MIPLYHIARVSDPVAQADEQLFCARRPDNGPQSEKAAALSPRQATLKWLDISRTSTVTVLINVLHTRLRGSTDFDPSDLLATGLGIAGRSVTVWSGVTSVGRDLFAANWHKKLNFEILICVTDMALPLAFQEIGNIQVGVWLRESRQGTPRLPFFPQLHVWRIRKFIAAEDVDGWMMRPN